MCSKHVIAIGCTIVLAAPGLVLLQWPLNYYYFPFPAIYRMFYNII